MASANTILYLLFLLVGLLAGWLAMDITRSAAYGRTVDLVAGAIVAFAGGYLFLRMSIQTTSWFWPLIVALGSAMIALGVLRALKNLTLR